MTWSYNWSFTTQKDQVRREIGDVDSTDQLLSDEEIAYAGSVEGSSLAVAARCCEWLAAQFGRKADMAEGKLNIKLSQRAQAFKGKAVQLRALDAVASQPYVGGESISDKTATDNDTDRVPSGFWRDMLDNPTADEVAPTVEGDEDN